MLEAKQKGTPLHKISPWFPLPRIKRLLTLWHSAVSDLHFYVSQMHRWSCQRRGRDIVPFCLLSVGTISKFNKGIREVWHIHVGKVMHFSYVINFKFSSHALFPIIKQTKSHQDKWVNLSMKLKFNLYMKLSRYLYMGVKYIGI